MGSLIEELRRRVVPHLAGIAEREWFSMAGGWFETVSDLNVPNLPTGGEPARHRQGQRRAP
jgi:hypothetical protein